MVEIKGYGRIGNPRCGLEKIVGMTRPRPQTAVADLALVCRVRPKGVHLSIGQALSQNRSCKNGEAKQVLQAKSWVRVARRQDHRHAEKSRRRRLGHHHPNHPRLEPCPPIAAEAGIAGVFGPLDHPPGYVAAEAQGPNGDHRRHHGPSPGQPRGGAQAGDRGGGENRARAEGPEHVRPTTVLGRPLHKPADGHDPGHRRHHRQGQI